MPDEQVPPVVAVVVSMDPGPWLEECLASLSSQDYANLSVLVVDAGSSEPIAARVATVAPDFFLHRLEQNAGFGPSANVVTGLVTGASHYLFCHDDVVLEPDLLLRLVEEAFRSNAGIAGPKLVDYDEPDRILQYGLGVDRFAAPLRRVERREFDQAQHDAVTEVFAVPGACTLVRADLFTAIGGFDAEISMFGEDVDLCWRARLAGARVVVVPSAIARHVEATSARRRPLPESRSLQWRHELRTVLKNYGRWRRVAVVTQLAVLSLLEILYFFAIGRRDRVRQVYGAWRWNLQKARGLREARAAVAALRRLPDGEVCSLLSHRTFRIWRSLRTVVEERAVRLSAESRARAQHRLAHVRHHHERRRRELTSIVVVLTCVLIFGARSLLVGHLPLVGDLLPLPSPTNLLARFFGGFDDAGSQSPGPASPAFALLGVGGLLGLGAMGVVLKVGLICSVVAGPLGVARLLRPFASSAARLAGAVCYLFLPLAWNALAAGDVPALICFGGMPFVLGRLLRASGQAPFALPSTRAGRAPWWREVIGFALLLALLAAFVPVVPVLALVLAVVLGLGGLLSGGGGGTRRMLGVCAASVIVAFVLLAPWSITFVQSHTSLSVLTGAASDPSRSPVLGMILRLYLGPIGKGVLGWAFLVAGLFVLVSGAGERLSFGIRMWAVVLSFGALTWAASAGWLGPGGGTLRVLISPFAVALSVLVGLGAAIVLEELRESHLGWHHLAAFGFVVCCVAGLLPVLAASLPGRFSLPANGYDSVLSWMNSRPGSSSATSSRLLWLGDPEALPGGSWQIRPGLALGLSEGGLPDATRLFLSPNPGTARLMAGAIAGADSGTTVRLGALLAPYSIHYIVVPTALAPVLAGSPAVPLAPPPEVLLDGLSTQSDLHELPTEGGAIVFENTAWHRGGGAVRTPRDAVPASLRSLGVAAEVALWLAVAGYYLLEHRHRRRERSRSRHLARSHPAPDRGDELAQAAG